MFPSGLTRLYLNDNQISSLDGVVFPSGLVQLYLNGNQITSLDGVVFPSGLVQLYLDENIEECWFPLSLRKKSFARKKIKLKIFRYKDFTKF